MRFQLVPRIGGVRDRYAPGVGATPVLRTSRVGSAALVAPTSRTPHIQRGYFPDLRWIQTGSVQRSALIHVATGTDTQQSPT
jgi:hypothetical protein